MKMRRALLSLAVGIIGLGAVAPTAHAAPVPMTPTVPTLNASWVCVAVGAIGWGVCVG